MIIFIFILITGALRCFEAAVIGANVAKLQRLAEDGEKSAKNALKLAENPNKFYNSLRILTVLIQLIMIFEASRFMPSLLFGSYPQFLAYTFSI
ncbi:MAG: CNNM domain-containing protein, partial [Firmicutes bacterium]|nr:CNNM domain-containing protein [Bacillota bacterium]